MSKANLLSSGSILSQVAATYAADKETGSGAPAFKWVTTGVMPGFPKKNVALEKPARIAQYFRTVANEGRDTPIETDDDAILSVVMSNPAEDGESHEDHETRLVEMIEKANDDDVTDDTAADDTEADTQDDDAAEAEADETADADAGEVTTETEAEGVASLATPAVDVRAEPAADVKQFARQVAAKMADSPEFMSELNADMDAGEKVKRAPLMLMLIVRKLYTNEEMGGWPIPNTTHKEKHNNPDKRLISVRDVESGEWKNKTVGFYDLVFSALPEGKKLDNEIDAIRKRKTDNNSKWRTLHDDVANSERKTREARRTSGRTLLRRAIALHMQFAAVKRDLPELKASYILVKDAKTGKQVPTNSTYPIIVKEMKASLNEGDGEAAPRATTVSVTQFLGFKVSDALNPEKVKEKGSVYDAFIGSSGKGSEDDADRDEQAKQMDVEQAVDVLGLFAGWSSVSGHIDQLRKRMRDDVHVMQSVCRAALELQPLYQQFKVPFDHAEAGDEAKARAMLANRQTAPRKVA